MTYVLSGKKSEMEKCKLALLKADGDFGVNIVSLSFNKIGLFNKYELKVELDGNKDNLKRFNKRVSANYDILNGNIIGMLEYM